MPPIHLDPEDIGRLGPKAQHQIQLAMGMDQQEAIRPRDPAKDSVPHLRRTETYHGNQGMPGWLVFAIAGIVVLVIGLAYRAVKIESRRNEGVLAGRSSVPAVAQPANPLAYAGQGAATIPAPASVQVEIRRTQQGKSAHVSWSPVSGASGYEVWQWRPGDKTATFVGGTGASQTEMDVPLEPGLERVAYSVRAVGMGGIRSEATASPWVDVPKVQTVSFGRDREHVGTIDLPEGWTNQIADQQGGHWVWGDPQNPARQAVVDIMGEIAGPPRFRVAELVDSGANQKPMSPYSIRWSSYALQVPGYVWYKQATVGGACSDVGCSQAIVVSVSMQESEADAAWRILDSVKGGIAEAYEAKVERIWLADVSGRSYQVRTDTLTCINVREQGFLFNLIDDLTGRTTMYRCWEDNNLNGHFDDGDSQFTIDTNDQQAAAYIRPQLCPEPLTENVTWMLDGYRIRVPIRLVAGSKTLETTAIIDTGAPSTVFPKSLLDSLGERPDTGIPYLVGGVGGGKVKGYTYSIRFPQLRIKGRWWLTGPRYDLLRVSGIEDRGAVDILLGQDWLARSGSKLEIKDGKWTLKIGCFGQA